VLSRPTVREVLAYRQHIDRRMREATTMIKERDAETRRKWADTVELGLHHEQQHQELLFMDIKHILSHQLELPALPGAPVEGKDAPQSEEWVNVPAGLHAVGCRGDEGFCFDNERSRHQVHLRDFSLRAGLITNREFNDFIEDGGYKRPELWLSDGWEWVRSCTIRAPLYWILDAKTFTLQGEANLNPKAPVCHVSYYEADAFARWKKCRLPTEYEWEVAFSRQPRQDLWQWTMSAYLPYPGFKPFADMAQEYNGKFMSGQMVLRGGCFATPASHYRSTYRNFFYPSMRWMFSGIRLCAQ
jgi:ergothioneine biosynthesis protein EgtB